MRFGRFTFSPAFRASHLTLALAVVFGLGLFVCLLALGFPLFFGFVLQVPGTF